ncbi:hypothetical protein [Actinoplanes sp. NPDC049316]|uniref:trypsin-like serine peptidase n=1 Tax=Actinoplanes sp. NPDC049316 TaxID=3154727 RepID=UPI00341DB73C
MQAKPTNKTPRQLRAFWTPQRLREAIRNSGTDAAVPPAGGVGGTSTSRPTAVAGPGSAAPAAPPKNSAALRGKAATAELAAAVTASRRVSNVAAWPMSAVGRLFYTDATETEWFACSATSIATNNRNSVWTAAHCLHAGPGGDWRRNHVFIPAYSNNSNPYGWWYGVSVLALDSWIEDRDYESSDLGALIVVPETGSANLQDTVGGWGHNFRGGTAYTNARSFGYPASGYNRPDSDFFNGEYMMYCEGNTIDADNNNPFDDRIRMSCDMGGGASGGPIATGVGSSNVQIVGSNSHRDGDANGNYVNNHLYSSNHYNNAAVVINALNS